MCNSYVWQNRDIENIGKHWKRPTGFQKYISETQTEEKSLSKASMKIWKYIIYNQKLN